MRSFALVAAACLALCHSCEAFTGAFPRHALHRASAPGRAAPLAAVKEVSSEAEFDQVMASSGDALVVVDYSTTWCGPCKVMEPKFVALSDETPQAVFLKVVGDSSAEASKLMKREGVRSVPSFHFWKNKERLEVVNGANTEALEGSLRKLA